MNSEDAPSIVFYIPVLSETGGGSHALTLLALELAGRGCEVDVVTHPPFNPDHRYVRWLRERRIDPHVLWALEGSRTAAAVERMLAPFVAVAYKALKGRPIGYSWNAARSIVRTRFARIERAYVRRVLDRVVAGSGRTILHIWGPTAWTPYLLAYARARGVPAIYHEMGEADEAYAKFWHLDSTIEALDDAASVVCCSPLVAENVRRVYRYRGPIQVMPFMIAGPNDRAQPERTDNHSVTFGTIGRLVPHKRYDEVIRAIRELHDRGYDARLLIAGGGPSRGALESLALELAVSRFVEFTGEFESLDDVMNRFDVFVLVSASESQCMPVTESMAYGKPVVAAKIGGIPDFVEDGATGFLVPLGDHERLVAALERLIADPSLRRKMGRLGRERYLSRCTPAHVADQMLQSYMGLRRVHAAGD